MDASRRNLTRTLLTSLVILIGCSTAVALVCSSRILAYYFARQMNHDDPRLALTPQPLTDYGANLTEGMSFSEFGYDFEVPWKDVDKVRRFKSLTMISFKSGQTVTFFDPQQTVDRIKIMREAAVPTGKDVSVLFGSEAMASNYQLLNTILSTTQRPISILTPSKELVRNWMLLTSKQSELINDPSHIYSIETPRVRGFQKGDPFRDQKATILNLFVDKQDHELQLWVAMKESPARITQADINRIVQTLHPSSDPK
jgi:hypothetical protein